MKTKKHGKFFSDIPFSILLFFEIAAVVFVFYLAANANGQNSPCSDAGLPKIEYHTGMKGTEIISRKPAFGMCQVMLRHKQGILSAFVGNKGDYVIVGSLYKGGVSLTGIETERIRKQLFRNEALPILSELAVISHIPKNSSHSIYIVVDPMCSHCSLILPNMKSLADSLGFQIHLILHSLSDNSKVLVKQALCKKLSYDGYIRFADSPPEVFSDCPEAVAAISRTSAAMGKFGIQGTPVFIFEDGFIVRGANFEAVFDHTEIILKN